MPRDAGFSLLEVVVALAVFALGSTALLNVLGESQRAQQAGADKALGRIVAENRLVEAMGMTTPPPSGVTTGEEIALDRIWSWEMRVAPSPDPRLLRIDVSVREKDHTQVVAEFSSFRAAR